MSGSQFEAVFNIAPTIAGNILGSPYAQYRPGDDTNAIASENLLATISAWITADVNGRALKPSNYAKPIWYGMFDPTQTQVGDYLVGPLGTFFIASQDAPHPFQVISCNRTVNITKSNAMPSLGKQNVYGGDQRATELDVATGFPCSMLQGTKGEVGSSKLPGDAKQPWVAVLLPTIPGVTLRNDFILTDDLNHRFVISSVELTGLGYRITAMLATT